MPTPLTTHGPVRMPATTMRAPRLPEGEVADPDRAPPALASKLGPLIVHHHFHMRDTEAT